VRVLLATEVFAPSTGGTERHVAALAERLKEAGHHAVVATTSPGPASDPGVVRLTGWSNALIRFQARPEQRFHPPAPDPGLIRALARLCRSEDIDVVHAHGWIAHSAVPAARQAGVPVVVSLHDYGLDCAVRNRLRSGGESCPGATAPTCVACATARYGPARGPLIVAGLLGSRRWWKDVAAFIANGESVADAARQRGLDCTVVSPWLAPTLPDGDDEPVPDLPAGDFVAYVGALAPHKGVGVLAQAWTPQPTAPLVALGARAEAGAPELPDGTFLYRDVEHAQVLATLGRAAVTVVPSVYPEPFGLVATEAMWAGSPVVASAVGELPHVLDGGRAGVLVPPGDPQALRAAVEALLHDPAGRATLAAAGRLRAAELDGLDAILDVYRQASPRSLRM
jgi:glycosyltransferase involved in cell wall biosynthesis